MRKSLCTLIVMIMTMALSLPMNAQALKVAKKANAQTTAISTAKGVMLDAAMKVADKADGKQAISTKFLAKTKAMNAFTGGLRAAKNGKMSFGKMNIKKAPTRVLANGVELGGMVVYSPAISTGIYNLEADGTFADPLASVSGGTGVLKGDRFYNPYLETFLGYVVGQSVTVYNAETWEVVNVIDLGTEDFSFSGVELAYDPTTDNIYGCMYNEDLSGLELAIVDYEAMQRVKICDLTDQYSGMAFDKTGQLFAVKADGTLVKVNKGTGDEEVIGNTGFPTGYLVGATIDYKSGDMYMTISTDDDGYLVKINTATAEAELVCSFVGGEEVTGLFIPGALAEDGAPAAVENLTVNFVDAALNGTVSFKAPITTFAGETLTVGGNYVVTANGEVVADGIFAPGEEITANIEVAEAGNYEIIVVVSNEAGESPKAKAKLYIGEDYAAPVNNVVLAYEDGKMSLTWDATHGVNGGYIDMAKVTYTVTRTIAGEEAVVAEGLTECAFVEEFPEPEAMVKVVYAVKAVYNDEESWATESNTIIAGAGIVPPYTEDFEAEDALDLFTIVDANEDGKTWVAYVDNGNGCVRISYNTSSDMDDWLITSPIKMEAGKNYDISFLAKSHSTSYPEAVEAYIAKASDVESLLAGVKIASNDALPNTWEKLGSSFVPEEDGKYYIGIHGCSVADQYYLYVDDLTVSSGAAGNAPDVVTDLAVISDENGANKATVKFTTPAKDITGADLASLTKVEIKRDGEVIGEVAPVEPATEYSYVDETLVNGGVYTYTVVAYNESGAGKEASASEFVGAYTAPWSEDFESLTNVAEAFTVIDANNDGRTWTIYNTGEEQGKVARMQYNGSMAMDDWMISAPILLEKGKLYEISFKAAAYGSSYPERVEAFIGNAPTVEAMTNVIAEPTVLDSKEYVTITETFAPQATGRYYIGIHGISDADMFYLYVDDIAVSAGASATTPAAPEVAAVAAADGSLSAELTIVAPSKDQSGEAIDALTKIEVSRDGELIETIETVAPGETLTLTDVVETTGNHTWEAVAYNADGKGKVAKATTYVGFDVPSLCTDIAMVETTPGKVKISWNAPATDVNGKPISGLTYSIIDLDTYQRVATGIEATEYEFQAVEDGEQNFVQYAVGASNEIGEGDFDVTNFMVVGTAYAMPYEEGFADGKLSSIFGMSTVGNASWGLFTPDSFSDPMPDPDDNGGFVGMKGSKLYDAGSLFTGKISLVGAEKPILEFYYMPLAADNENTLEVAVRVVGDEEWTVVVPAFAQGEAYDETETWIKKTVDLSAYIGKEIQIQWTAEVLAYTYSFIDAIKVKDAIDNDLMAKAISAPAKANINDEFEINVTVVNNGMNDAEGYTVQLYRRGEGSAMQEVAGEPIVAGGKAVVTFTDKLGMVQPGSAVYYNAVIVYDLDENTANNETSVVSVVPVYPKYPAVDDLTAHNVADGIELAWSEPNLDDVVPEAVTEDFEGAESFAQAVEGWTFVDEDGAPCGGIQNLDIPGVTAGSSPLAWFVFDNSDESKFNASFAAHSGNKFMSNMFNYDSSQNSDWMISPELAGCEQTISLWARSYTTQYGAETLKVLYSTTDKELSSFTEVKTVQPGAEWEEVTFDVPEGAKYFAIQCYSKDNFMLFIDDVTYIPAEGAGAELALVGYNVYRDGVKITDEPVAEPGYVDTNVEEGVYYTYTVTVVYEQGESAPSNRAVASLPVGINSVDAAANSDVKAYTVDGRKVNAATANGLLIIEKNGKRAKIVK